MKKIISLFQRDYDGDRKVIDVIVPGAEWVLAGEGVATRKYDGTCCLIKNGTLYKRYELKRDKQAPDGFAPAQAPDPITGDTPGWVKVSRDNPADVYHVLAFDQAEFYLDDWTYELCGPNIQKNPEKFQKYVLVPHGKVILPDCPRDFSGIKAYLAQHDYEGIVWWRDINDQNCDKVKIKKKDFSDQEAA